jgi:hypothetical protein
MKIAHVETLVARGGFPRSATWQEVRAQIHDAIRAMD